MTHYKSFIGKLMRGGGTPQHRFSSFLLPWEYTGYC
jgi:hypothetical protein